MHKSGYENFTNNHYNHIRCAYLGLRSYKSLILQRSAKLGEIVPIRLYPDRFLTMGIIKIQHQFNHNTVNTWRNIEFTLTHAIPAEIFDNVMNM